ncbi:2'-5' RNA ligase family protein [Mycobacteroides abscessus]|uniref:2'-5' RNA ligase family protein n=1 Tax=Mycobacteroides abscessus TaxID=36809 RepID=UPI0009A72533|nr:2'-5' RNA ligase family protein [Mycobacteroides abscessus]RIT42397.1 hypothetical protein D2E80_22275 [Mycobacteroides abscessus]SKT79198.1 Uncharacterised protein [Mycobacteroides abscessus subsp. massiliense]SKU02655.1 Uncharacterised protein [Mycobacteroides abscessus subsp. massiliense]
MAIDHFLKHQRARTRTDWNFNILFDDQPQVAHYARQYRQPLDHAGLYPAVPGRWLHATVLRIGFIDAFSEDELLVVAARLEPKLAALKMPAFLLGQWWIWGGNPCIHFTPEDPLRELYDLVAEELVAVVGNDRLPQLSASFTPHVSLAYSKTYHDETGLFNAMQSTRVQAVPVRVNRLSLVKQHVRNHFYAWDIVKEIPVGQLRQP